MTVELRERIKSFQERNPLSTYEDFEQWEAAGFPEPELAGLRYNEGKPELSMVMEAGKALEGCARVLEFGKAKYSRGNWLKGLPLTSVVDSMLRHIAAFMSAEDVDEESKLAHVDHIMTNALFLSQLYHTRPDMDDRVKQ